MKCPKCQLENREGAKFCLECGQKLELECAQCGKSYPLSAKFCDECGHRLGELDEAKTAIPKAEGERKHVTVLFSDLSGYTTISERLDPEEVKEIIRAIFKEISQVITKYDGFIEKFLGDAVMALFGVPKLHEDDPIRAIRAAREIHELVEAMSPQLEGKVGQPLSMHTGINTGLVVTGEVDYEKGTHGVSGDTVNVASRLEGLSRSGEILVGPETYRLAEGYFEFEKRESTEVKGKTKPVQVYRVLHPKEKPDKIHRLSGFRADLIGRKAEMARLAEAAKRLKEGRGSIISICGGAGTGKSRLVEEFKASLDLDKIQWLEGNSYAYAQNIPYFPMIDLLNRVFQIKEGDSQEKVKEAVESIIESLVGNKEEVAPYVGSLYALNYAEVENISPEVLKSRLQDSLQTIISSLAQKTPTVFLLEDLQWADPSFVELLRRCLLEIRTPAITLCVYRPPFSLLTSHQLSGIAKIYHEIVLQDLSLSETQDMLESLLNSDAVPYGLKRIVQEKSEGNPFYLEELINSLIDSKTLIRDDSGWKLTKSFDDLDISSTISGIISSRLDRLEKEAKRIIQEASVIGRMFLYEILRRVTELKEDIDRSIRGLEQIDLIRTRSFDPDLEYIFKHALTQEVVYNGLLKKARQIIHERIGFVMEELFKDRLPEFYETLAFHFKKGKSIHKAVYYLSMSGEKSFKKSALDEAHKHFQDAYDILIEKSGRTKDEENLLIDLLVKWTFVFTYGANYRGLADLLGGHIHTAESLEDKERLGKFYACLGYALTNVGKPKDSHQYLLKALRFSEEAGHHRFTGFSCSWLSVTCSELGLLEDAISFGKRGQEIFAELEWDPLLFVESFGHGAHGHANRGAVKELEEIGNTFLDMGRRYADYRHTSFGYFYLGWARLNAGDFTPARELCLRAMELTKDPVVSYGSRMIIAGCYLASEQVLEAESTLEDLLRLDESLGGWVVNKTAIDVPLALILFSKWDFKKGMRIINDVQQFHHENGYRCRYAIAEYMLGRIYLRMVQKAGPINLAQMAKNIGFLVKNLPFAAKKSESHFSKAIETSKEIGAKGILGQSYLYLGLLHKAKKRASPAKECISEAIILFKEYHADMYLKQAKEVLASLE